MRSMQMLRMVPYPAVIFLFIIWFGDRRDGQGAPDRIGHALPHVPEHLQRRAQRRPPRRRGGSQLRAARPAAGPPGRSSRSPCRRSSPACASRPGISVIALVFTESIGANQGIGYLVSQADSLQQIPVLVVCIIIYALLGIAADLLVRLLERVAMPWRRHRRSDEHDAMRHPAAAVVIGVGVEQVLRASAPCCTASTSPWRGGNSLRSSARRAAARPRCCASWPGSRPAIAGEVLVPEVRTVVYQEPRLSPPCGSGATS